MSLIFNTGFKDKPTSTDLNDKIKVIFGKNSKINDFTISPLSGRILSISAGSIIISGCIITKTDSTSIEIPTNNGSTDLIYYIYSQYLHESKSLSFSVTTDADLDTTLSNVLFLGKVVVAPGITTILGSSITNFDNALNLNTIRKLINNMNLKLDTVEEGAEVNNNIFFSLFAEETEISPEQKTDSLKFKGGDNINIVGDNSLKEVTINTLRNFSVDSLKINKINDASQTIYPRAESLDGYVKHVFLNGISSLIHSVSNVQSSTDCYSWGATSPDGKTYNEKMKLTTLGNLSLVGTVSASKVFSPVWEDYAEWYTRSDEEYKTEPGDIVSKIPSVLAYSASKRDSDKLVVGVCSDTYGHILGGEDLENNDDNIYKYIPVAISGRVNVKVIGKIEEGDLIVSSCLRGVGRAVKPGEFLQGCIIGKSLESYNNSEEIGKIAIQIMLS